MMSSAECRKAWNKSKKTSQNKTWTRGASHESQKTRLERGMNKTNWQGGAGWQGLSEVDDQETAWLQVWRESGPRAEPKKLRQVRMQGRGNVVPEERGEMNTIKIWTLVQNSKTSCVCLTHLPAAQTRLLLKIYGASWREELDNTDYKLLSSWSLVSTEKRKIFYFQTRNNAYPQFPNNSKCNLQERWCHTVVNTTLFQLIFCLLQAPNSKSAHIYKIKLSLSSRTMKLFFLLLADQQKFKWINKSQNSVSLESPIFSGNVFWYLWQTFVRLPLTH